MVDRNHNNRYAMTDANLRPPPDSSSNGSTIPAPTPSFTHAESSPTPPPISGPDVTDPFPPQQQDAPVDPRLAALRAMFPDYDDSVLQSVLESVGGNQGRAVDMLLLMNDPEYKGEPTPTAIEPEPPMSQTELDEQFARQLLMEDQQRQEMAWKARQNTESTQRTPNSRLNQVQAPDTIASVQQQFTKIAESGKKTFGNIFSKVKAKIQEMDSPRQSQSASGSYSRWGASSNDGYDPSQYEQRLYDSRPQQPVYTTVPQPQPYNPTRRTTHSETPQHQPNPQIQGYDVTPVNPTNPTISAPTSTRSTPDAAVTVNPPPRTGAGLPIDGGKFGLLPKRPVSLLGPQSSEAHQIQRQESRDSGELEYAENPFEDGKK